MRGVGLFEELGLDRARLPIFFILINAFLWYYLTLSIITNIANVGTSYILLLTFHSAGVIIGGISGLFFFKNRYGILLSWTFLGVATSSIIFIPGIIPSYSSFVCFGWGIALGFGMPSALGYFSDIVPAERRGRLGGLIFLFALSSGLILNPLAQLFGSSFMYPFFFLWRMLGALPFLVWHPEARSFVGEKRLVRYFSALKYDKRLYLFLTPWLIFNIVDAVEGLLLRGFQNNTFPQQHNLFLLVSLAFTSVFAFAGGLLSDVVGRKPMMILGFSTSGIAYALISVAPTVLPVWFLFKAIDGFAWGLFYSLFTTSVWGDISPKDSAEFYYLVGSLPLFLAAAFQYSVAGYMAYFSAANAFSLAALMLFVAVLPILFAPEPLPEKKIKERELKIYVDQAKKIKEKYA